MILHQVARQIYTQAWISVCPYVILIPEWSPEHYRLPGDGEKGASIIQIAIGVLNAGEFIVKRCFIIDLMTLTGEGIASIDTREATLEVMETLFTSPGITKLGTS
jgi:hypothetical protein